MLNQVFKTFPKFKSKHYHQESPDKEPLEKREDVRKSGWRFVTRHPVPSKQRTSFNFFVQRATENKNVAALDLRCQGGNPVSLQISVERLCVSVDLTTYLQPIAFCARLISTRSSVLLRTMRTYRSVEGWSGTPSDQW